MNKFKIILPLFFFVILCISSCSKEKLSVSSNPEYSELSNPQALGAVVYASFSCKTDDGKDGCNCEMTSSDDDCNYLQDCTSSEIELSNYWAALNNMFSIENFSVRITFF